MKKMIKFITVSVIMLFIFGCTQPFSAMNNSSDFGFISLSFSENASTQSEMVALSVTPNESADIEEYVIIGESVDTNDSFVDTISAEEDNFESELRRGEWVIRVEALNENGSIVGVSQDITVTIKAGQTESKSISVSDLKDDGIFNLDIDWSDEDVQDILSERYEDSNDAEDAVIDLTIENSDSEEVEEVEKTIEDPTDITSWNESFDLSPGYYTVSASVDFDGITAWSADLISVRISANFTSEKNVVLTTDDPNDPDRLRADIFDGEGGLTIEDETTGDAPFSVELEQSGRTITLVSEGDVESEPEYTWFVDGEKQEGEDSESIELPEESGEYAVSASLESDGHIRSDYGLFEISKSNLENLEQDEDGNYIIPSEGAGITLDGGVTFDVVFDIGDDDSFTITFVRDGTIQNTYSKGDDNLQDGARRVTDNEDGTYTIQSGGNIDTINIDIVSTGGGGTGD